MIGRTNSTFGGGSFISVITFTLEGAKGDNITINNSIIEIVGNVIFDTDAVSKEHTMIIPPDGAEYTFTSSVAKDTETGTSDYSKTVALTKNTDVVKVMPDVTVYWYGNVIEGYEIQNTGESALVKDQTHTPLELTLNQNSFTWKYNSDMDTGQRFLTFGTQAKSYSGLSKIKAICSAALTNMYDCITLCGIDLFPPSNATCTVDKELWLSVVSGDFGKPGSGRYSFDGLCTVEFTDFEYYIIPCLYAQVYKTPFYGTFSAIWFE